MIEALCKSRAVQTAVLFLVFNRPEPTARVFEAIRRARPPRLYIGADGPRADRAGEAERVAEARRIATAVDWPCDVKTLFRERNLGCKEAVSNAIDWFFEHENEGIILEDDCVPSLSFFNFTNVLLEKYRRDTRIWQVCGATILPEQISLTNYDYFFSRYGPTFGGWATWRRAWKYFDADLSYWDEMSRKEVFESVYPDIHERVVKRRIGENVVNGQASYWDYQWGMTKNYQSGLSIIPCKNQILNIGFGDDATHTTGRPHYVPDCVFEIGPSFRHPKFVVADRQYEEAYCAEMFSRPSLIRRMRNRIRGIGARFSARLQFKAYLKSNRHTDN